MGQCCSVGGSGEGDARSEYMSSIMVDPPREAASYEASVGPSSARLSGESKSNGSSAVDPGDVKPRPGIPDAKHFGLQETHVVLDVLGR